MLCPYNADAICHVAPFLRARDGDAFRSSGKRAVVSILGSSGSYLPIALGSLFGINVEAAMGKTAHQVCYAGTQLSGGIERAFVLEVQFSAGRAGLADFQ